MSSKTFHIPKKSHGALIGKGGATVKELQTEHHAKIAIPSQNDPFDGVVVTAKPDDIEAVRREFERILGFKVGTDPIDTVRLDIEPSDHGAIIGSQGSTLKKIEAQFGVNIDVPRRDDPSHLVLVEGPRQAVEGAIKEIGRILGYPPKRIAGGAAGHGAPEAKQAPALKLDYSKPIQHALFFPDPDGEDFEIFIKYLDAAQTSLDVCVFTIYDDRVSRALLNRHRSGVKVRVITDNDTALNLGSDIQLLADAGIETKTDTSSHHMHHKFAVIDGQVLVNGSFNWTKSAATSNAENLMITNDKFFVGAFQKNFNLLWSRPDYVNVPKKA